MLSKSILATAVAAVAVSAADLSLCDKYTTALLTNNTAKNQETLLTLVVNTAVIGNYTKPNVGIAVPGILAANATYNGVDVNLAKYFDGSIASTNGGGSSGIKVNFLDGGGAAPLEMNMAANSTSSAQYKLLTHLYSYFGLLLGCSQLGQADFPAYAGRPGMYDVHKFMKLDENEVGYFIEQVGLSAASFGVSTEDVTAVGDALNKFFGYRCSPKTVIVPTAPAQYQSICIDADCPIAPNATCAVYPFGNATATSPASSGVAHPTAGSNSTSTPYTGAAAGFKAYAFVVASVALGAVAFLY